MTDNTKDISPTIVNMLSIEQLRSYHGFENKSDTDLTEIAEFLKEFSLILYHAYMKQASQQKLL